MTLPPPLHENPPGIARSAIEWAAIEWAAIGRTAIGRRKIMYGVNRTLTMACG